MVRLICVPISPSSSSSAVRLLPLPLTSDTVSAAMAQPAAGWPRSPPGLRTTPPPHTHDPRTADIIQPADLGWSSARSAGDIRGHRRQPRQVCAVLAGLLRAEVSVIILFFKKKIAAQILRYYNIDSRYLPTM